MSSNASEPEPETSEASTGAPGMLYSKWIGVLLGFILAGSAHFLSGNRRAGIVWYCACIGTYVAGFTVMAIPGSVVYIIGSQLLLAAIVLNIGVLVSSCRPVPGIGWRGWVAVIGVSIILRIAIQSTVQSAVQPFKVLSGAMEPTLMGIKVVTVPPDAKPGLMERWYTGASWKEIRARAPGTFESSGMNPANPIEALWRIGSENYVIPHWSVAPPEIGRRFAENDLIWSGTVTRGDHVICNRMTYRFRDPARGEIIVFHTDGIPGLPAGQMFVKRLVGLPGERIEIRPPDVFVNGEPVKFPDFFTSMAEKRNGLPGYQQLSFASRSGEFSIAMNRYFVIGDNSPNSSDSRDWGTVPRANIIGCVTRIYWPIARANALK